VRPIADKPWSEAAEKNAAPVLEILRHEFQDCAEVLEIGSGTGQHAVHFASRLGHLRWQTSDLDENHAGITAWLAEAGLANVLAPISLDVSRASISASYDAVYSANTAHIMSFNAVIKMLALVGRVLSRGGVFCLYGPFRRFGQFNTSSNARFDASLRSRHAAMGIRDLEDIDQACAEHGLRRSGLYAVPSNNLVVVWQKVK
jgi:cyclopropane fatty-acyl-phospholipid synthase-like methyltransferase